jgi:hypothetical protein
MPGVMQKKTKKIISIILIALAVSVGGLAALVKLTIKAFHEMGNCASAPQELLRYATFSEPPEYVKNVEGGGYCITSHSRGPKPAV